MKVHNYFIKGFGVLLVAALLFAALPAGAVKAQTGQTLFVSDWGTPVTAFQPASGAPRPTVVYDGSLYHLWYGGNLMHLSYSKIQTRISFISR